METGKTVSRFFDRAVDIMAFIAGVLAVIVMMLLCYMVIMRYIFSKPPAWVLEICEYSLIYITFLSTTWLLRQDGHVRVDLFLNWTPPSIQKSMRVLTSLVGGGACAILSWCSLLVTVDNYVRNILTIQTLSIPKWILFAIIPVGTLFLAIEFFRQAHTAFQDLTQQQAGTENLGAAAEEGI